MSSPSLPQLPVSLPRSCSRLLQPNSAKPHFLLTLKSFIIFNFLFYTGVWLIYNVVIVSSGHQRDSATHILVSILPQTLLHLGWYITLSRVPTNGTLYSIEMSVFIVKLSRKYSPLPFFIKPDIINEERRVLRSELYCPGSTLGLSAAKCG